MRNRRNKIPASVFELFCILPFFILSMAMLSVIFVVSLPFIVYKELVDNKRQK